MILEILCAVLAVLCLVLWKLVRGPSLSGDVLLGRHTAFVKNNGQPFVVFLIGARVNDWTKVFSSTAAFAAFTQFGKLAQSIFETNKPPTERNAADGCLGSYDVGSLFAAQGSLVVQYWRSYEELYEYAHKSKEHQAGWAQFVRDLDALGAVGIWHETYIVQPGAYETVYGNMPLHLLARCTEHVEIVNIDKSIKTGKQRMEASHKYA